MFYTTDSCECIWFGQGVYRMVLLTGSLVEVGGLAGWRVVLRETHRHDGLSKLWPSYNTTCLCTLRIAGTQKQFTSHVL